MNQLIAIAKNTFLQTIRQPVYGIIVLVTLGGAGDGAVHHRLDPGTTTTRCSAT